jgi:probable DNA repair protein
MGHPPNTPARPTSSTQARLEEGLAGGAIVVAASERAARALTTAYHRARRAQALAAWPAPRIHDWESFVRDAWLERTLDARMILTPQQEQTLWVEIIAAHGKWLPGPLHRIARLAMEAHRLLCGYAPQFLESRARSFWQQDALAFSRWLAAFDDTCRTGGYVSAARLPLDLIRALAADGSPRSTLLLAGFDRMVPTQRAFFAAWGPTHEAPQAAPAQRVLFYRASDESTELAACALWCQQQLAETPRARLLVITQDAATRRGEIERTFLRHLGSVQTSAPASRLFEFSLGVPLSQVALARGALLVLRWLDAPLEESELDWLISTGQLAGGPEESRVIAAWMRTLRRRKLERTRWPLLDFVRHDAKPSPPAVWVARLTQAQQRLRDFGRAHTAARRDSAEASSLAWSELVPQVLTAAGWPGGRALSSAEYQALNRWDQALDSCASLGFTGRRLSWRDFLASLERTVSEMLFTPESQDAPILIAGPAESAGLEADGIWYLGATEDAWPASGSTHPLLPLEVQREAEMPHASAQLDWRLAESVTRRLLASAPELHFSFARMAEEVEARPSRLILNAAGTPHELPAALVAPPAPAAQTIWIDDLRRIPFPDGPVRGGASVLSAQSQCPFKAFAVARLGAERWEPAQAGLTPAQRGALLHHALHSIWSPPPAGIRSHADLLARRDSLAEFVQSHVNAVCTSKMPAGARASMPAPYLALEEARLTALLVEWLRYEAERVPFAVAETEFDKDVIIAGLHLHLRLDRVDRLMDNSLLVLDYKTGDVSPKSWDLPRPDDVQLPLYAGFALEPSSTIPGFLFAKVRVGETCFAGRMADARASLRSDLSSRTNLAGKPLALEELDAWRVAIEGLARAFLRGDAAVDPRDYPSTCENCGLQTLCRVYESDAESESEDGDGEERSDA